MPDLTARSGVGVVGAGAMGEGIAQVAASAGHVVHLYDTRPEAAVQAIERIVQRLHRSVEKGKRSADAVARIEANLRPAESLDGLAPAGLVVEAIVEDLDAKRSLFTQLESLVASDTVLTTNTSSISITAIASALQDPSRFAGMHFFNPAPVMRLVEVIAGLATDFGVIDDLMVLAEAWGKVPIRVASSPGFVGNRVARPFYGEAIRLLEEGVADVVTIDALMRGPGAFPLGPFELMDLVGIDVNLAVSTSVWEATSNDPRFAPSVLQRDMVASGRLGRKTGRGFHRYDDGTPAAQPTIVEPGPIPSSVELVGEPGPLQGLVDRLISGGVRVDKVFGGEPHLRLGAARLALTDGRSATVRDIGPNMAVVDLAHDYSAASLVAIAVSDTAAPDTLGAVAGLLAGGGFRCVEVDDAPGLVVARIVASLVNLAADTVHFGIASGDDVDTAMMLGFSYPEGPLAWGDRLGLIWVRSVIENLRDAYQEDRYRVSPLLARRAASGGRLAS